MATWQLIHDFALGAKRRGRPIFRSPEGVTGESRLLCGEGRPESASGSFVDPSGETWVFAEQNVANQFVRDLEKSGVKHATTITTKYWTFVVTDARDKVGLLNYANSKYKEVFDKGDFSLDPNRMKIADARNVFLSGSGLFGLNSKTALFIDDPKREPGEFVRIPADVAKEILKRQEIEGANPSIQVDIGGEGKYPDAFNVNVGAQRNGKTVPNLVAGVRADFDLPFLDNSVSLVTIESTWGFIRGKDRVQATDEIARIMKAGGKIIITQSDNPIGRTAFNDLLTALKKVWPVAKNLQHLLLTPEAGL